jgi:hypothetical protein
MKTLLLVLILGLSLGSCCGNSCTDNPEDDKSKNIGKTVTIDGQIWTIIDHYSMSEKYELSNGMTVSDEYPTNY